MEFGESLYLRQPWRIDDERVSLKAGFNDVMGERSEALLVERRS